MYASLNKKLCKDELKSFPSLTDEGKQAAEHLNDLLTNVLVLAVSRATDHYTFHTDVCDKQIDRVLLD